MKPFKIRITQCNVGRYNLFSSEESLSFYMSVYTEDNKVYEENGIKAQLHYSGEPDELYIFEEALDNLGEVFQKCFNYSTKVWSSIDYKAQCLLFAKTYHEYFDVLEFNMKLERDKNILEEIERLQKQLSYGMLNDISYEVEQSINKLIKSKQDSINYLVKQNSELKEDSDSYIKNQERINKYNLEIEDLKTNLIYENSNLQK